MEVIGTAEAAKLLGVSKKTVMRYAAAGILNAKPHQRGYFGRYHWVIERRSVEQLLQQHQHQE